MEKLADEFPPNYGEVLLDLMCNALRYKAMKDDPTDSLGYVATRDKAGRHYTECMQIIENLCDSLEVKLNDEMWAKADSINRIKFDFSTQVAGISEPLNKVFDDLVERSHHGDLLKLNGLSFFHRTYPKK